MNRRLFLRTSASLALSVPAALSLAPILPAQAAGEVTEQDRILGNPDAPVTLIEYASLTCPHCANFHKEILPEIKENWIDTGKARLVYRHFPLDGVALRGAVVAECFEGDRFFAFMDLLFKQQQNWAFGGDPVEGLRKIALLAGLNNEKYEACSKDEETMNRVLTTLQEAKDTYKINSTPSFVINGETYAGGRSYEEMSKLLEQAAD